MSSVLDQEILNSMRKSFKYSKKNKAISEKLLFAIIGISIVNSLLDSLYLVQIDVLLIISAIITVLSILAIYFERISNKYRKNGDNARHLLFFEGLINQKIINNSFQDVKDELIGKDIELDKKNISDYYYHNTSDVKAQKSLNFYESIFYEYKKRIYFNRKNQFRHYGFWIALFFLVLLGLILSSDNFGRMIFSGLTIVILSPLAINSIYLMIEWQNDITDLKEILDNIKDVSDIEELIYWFLEYTIIVRDVPFIPDWFYDEYHLKIENEYSNDAKRIEDKIISNWV